MGRKSEGRKKQRRETAKTQTRDIYREHSAHAPRITAFPRFRCDISLTLPPLRRFPFSFSLFLPPPLSVVPSREDRRGWRRHVGQRIRRTSRVADRQRELLGFSGNAFAHLRSEGWQGSRPGGLIKKTGEGGVMESDGSTLPVIEQTGRIQGEKAFLTHRCQPSTFPMVGDFCSQPFPCLRKSLVNDTLSRLYFFLSFYF